MAEKLKITLMRSPLGRKQDQIKTVRALGLRRIRHSVEQKDTPAIRGMVQKVHHLVKTEEI